MASVEIFCCYARKDQSLLNELKMHLIPLQRYDLINMWNETDINALGCTEEALDAYERSIQLDPNDDFVYHCKGDVLYDLERYEEALAAYDQAIRLDPNYASAYKGKAGALYELKCYKDALAAYNRAIRLNPHEADAYIGKGNTLKRISEDQKKRRKGTKKSQTSAEVDRGQE